MPKAEVQIKSIFLCPQERYAAIETPVKKTLLKIHTCLHTITPVSKRGKHIL